MSDSTLSDSPVDDSASLKVALVGPTHPYKGGVAAHTTAKGVRDSLKK